MGGFRNAVALPSVLTITVEIVKIIFAALFFLAGLVGSIIILIEAFKDEIWKGILCLVCGPYWLYYAIFDFEHEHKWPIFLLALCGSGIGTGILMIPT